MFPQIKIINQQGGSHGNISGPACCSCGSSSVSKVVGGHIDEGLVLLVLEVFPKGVHYGVLTGWGMAVEE